MSLPENGSSTCTRIPPVAEAPLMDEALLRDFVQGFFARGQEYLSLASEYGSPLYVLESEVLRRKSAQFQAAFRAHLSEVGFYYAVKSNNHPEVARILMQSGTGLDVSSGLELAMAVSLGAEDIVFSGPGKTEGELCDAVAQAERVVVLVDSFGELARLEEIAAQHHKNVRIGVRLTTNPQGLWRKFGILPEKLLEFQEQAERCPHLRFTGIQFHTSWNLTPAAQLEFISKLGAILARLPSSARRQIEFIDIGGGYWPPQGEWLQESGTEAGKLRLAMGLAPENNGNHYRLPTVSIEAFAEAVCRAIKEHILRVISCRICFEPGRWLCNDAMHLLLQVVDRKGDDLVITDGGTNSIGWERFETDYFPVLNLSRPAMEEKPCHVLGSLCTPHDVWGYNYWGEDIQPGDVLMIPTQGAYTYSLRQNFIKPLPEVAII
ncbi:MAG: alanine racemase [Proteobacteria bacterium]|nr:alanine racemase [Pseudomonadota bacterium]MBU1737449.1 alanine racemase [Pseudomonadota bacterium]